MKQQTKYLEFDAAFGNEVKKVKLMNPFGSGDGYHVIIDNYYKGIIVKIGGRWIGHLNPKSCMTAADIDILGDLIDGA